MTTGEFFAKRKYVWRIRGLRLLRERACVQYARQAVPCVVDGVHIEFPDTDVSLGLHVAVRSRRLEGRELLPMLYERENRQIALDMGITALKALHSADVTAAPFALFSMIYRLVRGSGVALGEMLKSPLLSPNQRSELHRLVVAYVMSKGGRKVLLHGDLHPSNLIVDLGRNSLGFIDLEAMRLGKAATNFAQLWGGFHFAHPLLGQRFYQEYVAQFPELLDEQFDTDVRAELALRSYSHIQAGRRSGNKGLEGKARILLASVLSGASFEDICCGVSDRSAESIH